MIDMSNIVALGTIMPPPPDKLMLMLGANTALFAIAALAFWGMEAAWGRFVAREGKRFFVNGRMRLWQGMWFAVRQMPWILVAAIGLSAVATLVAKRLGLDLPTQEMLKWLVGDTYSAPIKIAIVLFALVEAPFLEEIVFRRFLFRACHRYMPLWPAMLLSASLFALMHANALVFIPLVFVGGSFAWIYWRTGRLTAAMFAHFLFNAVNVILLLLFPEMA